MFGLWGNKDKKKTQGDPIAAAEIEAAEYAKQGRYESALRELGAEMKDKDMIEWAARHEVSSQALSEITRLKCQIEVPETEVDKHRHGFRKKIWKVLKWVGFGALGLGAVAGVWTAKQAIDAAPKAIKKTLEREVEERIETIKTEAEKMQRMVMVFANQIMEFLGAWFEQMTTKPSDLPKMIIALWKGLKEDAVGALDDKKLDKTLAAITKVANQYPEMQARWIEVTNMARALMVQKEGFEQSLRAAKSAVTSVDEKQAFDDFKTATWEEISKELGGVKESLGMSS